LACRRAQLLRVSEQFRNAWTAGTGVRLPCNFPYGLARLHLADYQHGSAKAKSRYFASCAALGWPVIHIDLGGGAGGLNYDGTSLT